MWVSVRRTPLPDDKPGLHIGFMAESSEEKVAKNGEWRERIAEQERSGISVKGFCKERGIAEHQFYYWRKRLRNQQQPMRFALVDRGAPRQEPGTGRSLELVLANGERLRIGTGVDTKTLRTVLELSGHDPPAGQRAGVSVPDRLRHAQEL